MQKVIYVSFKFTRKYDIDSPCGIDQSTKIKYNRRWYCHSCNYRLLPFQLMKEKSKSNTGKPEKNTEVRNKYYFKAITKFNNS